MRGGDDSSVELLPGVRSEPTKLTSFKRAEELRLKVDGELANLIQEERAAARVLQDACLRIDRAGKRTSNVTKELRFDELRSDGAGVKDRERTVLPRAVFVDGARQELLAGP